MATIQNNIPAQNQQDFIRIQDLFYLCLGKWHWFVISLTACLGIAVWYLLITPPVYIRTASILVKDDSKGKSTSDAMESFADFGMFTSNTNVNNEMGTLQSPDLMREVVTRLHLQMNYYVPGGFHRQTVYGDQLPVDVSVIDLPGNESASFTLRLEKDGIITLSDLERNGEDVDLEVPVHGGLNDTIQSPIGKIVVMPAASYTEGEELLVQVSHSPLQTVVSSYSSSLTISQTDEKSNIITLSFRDVSSQRAEDVLSTLIAVYNENWVKIGRAHV